MSMIYVSNADFEEKVLKSKLPVLVAFGSPTCPPCNAMRQPLAELAKEYEGRYVIAGVNVQADMALAISYGIRATPTYKLFHNGQVVATTMGGMAKEKLESFLIQG